MRVPGLTYANVVATLALFIALGGSSYAVITLPKNSVGSLQVRNRSLKAIDLAPSVKLDGSRGPQGPVGPGGAAGPVGVAGEQGPAGPAGQLPPLEAWKALPLIGGWQAYGSGWAAPAYRKDPLGRVELRGLATKSGVPSNGDVIAVLPEGFRPLVELMFGVHSGGNDTEGRVDVVPTGEIRWSVGSQGEKDFTNLSGISFSTD